jgi:CheY-like chemotaxis protein
MLESTPVVLIVDDEPNIIKLIRLAMAKAGFHNKICEAHDGEEAIQYLQGVGKFENRDQYPLPQLILLDLKMPRMGGLEFLKWFRHWPPGKCMPVVVLTTSGLSSDLMEAYGAGANSYVIKGGDAHALVEQMNSIGSIWLTGLAKLPPVTECFRVSAPSG